EAPHQALERRAGEEFHDRRVGELPMTFVKPEIRVVDGAYPRLESPEAEARSFEQPEIQDRPPGHGKRGEEKRENAVVGIIQQGRLPDDQRGEEEQPLAEQEQRGGDEIVEILPPQEPAAGYRA